MSNIRRRSPKKIVLIDKEKIIRLKDVIRDNDVYVRREYLDYRTGEITGWVTYNEILQNKEYYEPIGWFKESDGR